MEQATSVIDEEQYIVHNPKEVIQILSDMAKQKAVFKVSFNHGTDVYLTNIIDIDVQNSTVHLDIGRDEEFNRRLFSAHNVQFSKEDGVKIKWTSNSVSEVSLKDGKAVRIKLPQDLIRLQRREYFRFATPLVNPVLCKIVAPIGQNLDIESEFELTLVDVSLGGIGVLIVGPLNPVFALGASFDHCKINFPEVGTTDLTLKIKNITQLHIKDGLTKHRLGFQYIEPSRGNEGLINRYVFMLERQAIALAKGFT